jgi:RimJ/RimL family protein N-acetyltransferase
VAETTLIELDDADFDWLGRPGILGPLGLWVPPEGIDRPEVLAIIRAIVRRLHTEGCRGAWMIVAGDTVLGLCGYKRPPADGEVEIGYGIAPGHRERGHATRAIARMIEHARADPGIHTLTAETAFANPASGQALAKNGFVRTGARSDPADGELILWGLLLKQCSQ